MKIVHIIPGSGGTFYCQNCMRDNELIRALKDRGHEVTMVPMYLPLNVDVHGLMGDTPVFYGAINVFLKEKLPFYRHAPLWMERLFDSEKLLQMAARRAGSTRASGLEEMTLSTLLGEEGRQATELDHMIQFLDREIRPDVVHLSNALLLGLARRLKNDLNTSVVCSLQDENEWIDLMSPDYQKKVWDLMAERARDVHAFVAASRYYADRSVEHMNLPREGVHVVYGGVDLDGYQVSALPLDPPVLGYLCRMNEYFGLGVLIDAFIKLKKESDFKETRLLLTGGYSGDDEDFLKKMKKKLSREGVLDDVEILQNFDKAHRIRMLRSLTLLSVPVLAGEAFGAYQVEALAAGVPIVQPNLGGYPEFIELTGGGVLYQPNDGDHLAEALASLLSRPERLRRMGAQGRERVLQHHSVDQMADKILDVYREIVRKN